MYGEAQCRRMRMTNNRNIMLLLFLVYGIFVATLFANAFGVPFTDAELHSSLIYWVHALTALSVVVLLIGLGVLINMTRMMLTLLFGTLVIWILVHIFIFVMFVLELVSCDTSVQCAGNALPDGTFVGPYEGPSGTFLLNFIGCIILLILELLIAYLVYTQRRSATLSMMTQCATGTYGAGYQQPQQQYAAQQPQYAQQTTGYGWGGGPAYGQQGYVGAGLVLTDE